MERWSLEHPLLLPRALHLRAELACRSDADEVLPFQNLRQLYQAIRLFDQAALEADRLSALDCSAFVNERHVLELHILLMLGAATF